MATTKYEDDILTLIDGSKITVRPLKISLLRPFMKKFEGIAAVAEDNEKSMTLLIECVQIAMEQYRPELAGDTQKLEEMLDLPTVYRIVEAASGINLSEVSEVLGATIQ